MSDVRSDDPFVISATYIPYMNYWENECLTLLKYFIKERALILSYASVALHLVIRRYHMRISLAGSACFTAVISDGFKLDRIDFRLKTFFCSQTWDHERIYVYDLHRGTLSDRKDSELAALHAVSSANTTKLLRVTWNKMGRKNPF